MPAVAQERVDVVDAHPRQHALVGDAAADLLAQVCHQLELAFVARGKVDVPALRRHRVIPLAVKVDRRHPEPRPGGDEGAVSDALTFALVERVELFGAELADTEGGGFEVVDEEDGRDTDGFGQLLVVHLPGEVRRVDVPAHDRPGHAEAGVRDARRPLVPYEVGEDVFERAVARARIAVLSQRSPDAARPRLEERDVRLSPADVTRDYHLCPSSSPA